MRAWLQGLRTIDNWFGAFAPAKTPKDTLAQYASWFTEALEAPESKAKLATQYLYTEKMCGDQFGTFIRQRHDEYGKQVRDANLKVQ